MSGKYPNPLLFLGITGLSFLAFAAALKHRESAYPASRQNRQHDHPLLVPLLARVVEDAGVDVAVSRQKVMRQSSRRDVLGLPRDPPTATTGSQSSGRTAGLISRRRRRSDRRRRARARRAQSDTPGGP